VIKKGPGAKQDKIRKESLSEFSLNSSLVRGQEAFNEEMKSTDRSLNCSQILFNEDQSMAFVSESHDEDNFDYESLPEKLSILSQTIDPINFLKFVEPLQYLNDEVINFFLQLFHTLILNTDSKDKIVPMSTFLYPQLVKTD
jgi:Ulp1 family protease